jgi:hypothetical protein
MTKSMNYTAVLLRATRQPGRVSACEQAPRAEELRWQTCAAATFRNGPDQRAR